MRRHLRLIRYVHTGRRPIRSLRIAVCGALLLVLLSAGTRGIAEEARAPAGATVQVWLTTPDLAEALDRRPNLAFAPDRGGNSLVINVDEHTEYQQMDGFGAALTDTSAWLIAQKLAPAARAALMTALFSPGLGIGVDWLRIPMGSSDFTHDHYYSYDDNGGVADPLLTNFSIAHDLPYIVPLLKQALRLNPAIKFDANPWSPPAWMKSNHSLVGGGTLLSRYYGTLAAYFVKFLQAYQAEGLNMYAVQPQNEPLAETTYPSMIWNASDEARFIADYLGPALVAANLDSRILGYDHNWSRPAYPSTLLGNASAAAYLAGTAWHSYAGEPRAMTAVHDRYPAKDVYETESSVAHPADLFINAARNWSKTGVMWNIALDRQGGPLPRNPACRGCIGLATINQATGSYTFTNYYYEVGQFSKFVQPGAYRIASTSFGPSSIEDAAFENPNGAKVVVVYNGADNARAFNLLSDGASISYALPTGAVATFTWNDAPLPGPRRHDVAPNPTTTSTVPRSGSKGQPARRSYPGMETKITFP